VAFVNENDSREVFQIHLMHDAGVGRNNGEIAETGLAPAEKEYRSLLR